jgi:DnaK suppressor protein
MAEGTTEADRDLAEVEFALRAERERLHDQITKLTQPPKDSQPISFGKRVGDGTTEAISRFTDVGVANDLDEKVGRIDRALEKLEEGSYGLCDVCGKPIAAGRLKAAPESVLCIDDARAAR